MSWVSPVYNRTQSDVDYADTHRGNLTENIGARSHWTLQRIADNLRYASENLANVGVTVPSLLSRKTWLMTDIPRESDINKIKTDLQNLRSLGFTKQSTPQVPILPWTHYMKLNDVERILFDIVVVSSGIGATNRFSGTFHSGQGGLI